MAGVNRFQAIKKGLFREAETHGVPCVFISHSSKDKVWAHYIASHLKACNLDVYFDQDDEILQQAAAHGRDSAIVKCIQDGLNNSSHALCIVSNNSVGSQWVPYEIGYSASCNHPLALLVLKEVHIVPSFLKVADTVIPDLSQLDGYIRELLGLPLREGFRPFVKSVNYQMDLLLPEHRVLQYRSSE